MYYVTGHTTNKEDATHFVPVKTGDTKGRILIKGLEDDTYAMTEVRTDSGYVLLKQDIEVVISQKEGSENCTIYASDALGLIQNDPRYAQIIQSDANLKNIPQKHLGHKLLTASATVSGKKVNMAEDNGSTNAKAPLTVVNTRRLCCTRCPVRSLRNTQALPLHPQNGKVVPCRKKSLEKVDTL